MSKLHHNHKVIQQLFFTILLINLMGEFFKSNQEWSPVYGHKLLHHVPMKKLALQTKSRFYHLLQIHAILRIQNF